MKQRIAHTLIDKRPYTVYNDPEIRRDVRCTPRGKVEIGLGFSDDDHIELTPDEARLLGLRLIEVATAAEEELYS